MSKGKIAFANVKLFWHLIWKTFQHLDGAKHFLDQIDIFCRFDFWHEYSEVQFWDYCFYITFPIETPFVMSTKVQPTYPNNSYSPDNTVLCLCGIVSVMEI